MVERIKISSITFRNRSLSTMCLSVVDNVGNKFTISFYFFFISRYLFSRIICNRIIMLFQNFTFGLSSKGIQKCLTSTHFFLKGFCARTCFTWKWLCYSSSLMNQNIVKNNIIVLVGFQPTFSSISLLVFWSCQNEVQSETVERKYELSCNYFSSSTGMEFESDPLLFCLSFPYPRGFKQTSLNTKSLSVP